MKKESIRKKEREFMFKPFPITSICREDLKGICSKNQILSLTDSDMKHIARKILQGLGERLHEKRRKVKCDEYNSFFDGLRKVFINGRVGE